MPSKLTKARWLALSVQGGPWTRETVVERIARVLPPEFGDLERLAARLSCQFDENSAPGIDDLAGFFLREPSLQTALESKVSISLSLDSPVMDEHPAGLVTFPLPRLSTWKDVGLWLSLDDREIAWFADCKLRQSRVTEKRLHHYHYSWIRKRSGKLRLLEIPKSRLKEIQRTVLHDILNRIPAHPCTHGFHRGRSTKTFVAPHIGQDVILRFDLADFFHSVPLGRITALFRRLGYPPNVARLLQGFCTHSVSPPLAGNAFNELPWYARKRLQCKHLPQGAPSSPQLANLCAWRLDCRLQGFADRFGFHYTRYADDMAFSGGGSLARMSDFIERLVGGIAIEEGFLLNHRKTRLRTSSQRQYLAGIVANKKLNCRRSDWDQLKAILYNCVRYGPESQNRDQVADFKAHLRGRLAYISWINPSRGAKLKRLWDQIIWSQ